MTFSQDDIEALKYVLTELSDEELFNEFGEVFEVIKEKLKPYKTLIKRKRLANYSNKSFQLGDDV